MLKENERLGDKTYLYSGPRQLGSFAKAGEVDLYSSSWTKWNAVINGISSQNANWTELIGRSSYWTRYHIKLF